MEIVKKITGDILWQRENLVEREYATDGDYHIITGTMNRKRFM